MFKSDPSFSYESVPERSQKLTRNNAQNFNASSIFWGAKCFHKRAALLFIDTLIDQKNNFKNEPKSSLKPVQRLQHKNVKTPGAAF